LAAAFFAIVERSSVVSMLMVLLRDWHRGPAKMPASGWSPVGLNHLVSFAASSTNSLLR
jgi:hypothetical protein